MQVPQAGHRRRSHPTSFFFFWAMDIGNEKPTGFCGDADDFCKSRGRMETSRAAGCELGMLGCQLLYVLEGVFLPGFSTPPTASRELSRSGCRKRNRAQASLLTLGGVLGGGTPEQVPSYHLIGPWGPLGGGVFSRSVRSPSRVERLAFSALHIFRDWAAARQALGLERTATTTFTSLRRAFSPSSVRGAW